MAIQYTTTEVLDKYEKKFRHWGGDNETIRFLVLKKITGKDTTIYAQCEVENRDWQKTGQTSGLAVGSNGGWAVGVNDIEIIEKRKGIIRFTSADFIALIGFFNQFIGINRSGDPKYDKTWTAVFDSRFSISLTYDQARMLKWAYVLSIDGAFFELPADESIDMIKKLAGFRSLLK
jgi:hypothetical protein